MILASWYWTFYFISVAGQLSVAFAILGALSLLAQLIVWSSIDDGDDPDFWPVKHKRLFLWVGLTLIMLSALIPSRRDMILIVVGGTVFEYVQKDTVMTQLPHDVAEFLSEQMKGWEHEIEEKKK